MRRYLILISFVCFSLFTLGQEGGLYRNYTVEDGLPSSEVYFSFQDSKGYMWFATDGGVCRFNGYEFEVFNTTNGLTDNTVFRITEDAKGRIWFAPFNGRLCYYSEGKITEYHFNRGKDNMKWMAKLVDFYVDPEENIWLGTRESGIVKVTTDQILYLSKFDQSTKRLFHFIKINNNYISGSFYNKETFKRLYERASRTDTYVFNSGLDTVIKTIRTNQSDLSGGLGENNNFLYKTKTKLYLYLYNRLVTFSFEKGTIKNKTYPLNFLKWMDVLCGYSYKDEFWIGLKGGGALQYVFSENKLKLKKRYFPKTIITSIVKDRIGGGWFTSLRNGVFYKPNTNLRAYKNQLKSIYQLELDTLNKVLYMNGLEGKCVVVDLVTGIQDSIMFNEKTTTIGYNHLTNHIVWSSIDAKSKKIIEYAKGNYKVLTKGQQYSNYFKDILIEEDSIYLVSNRGLHIVSVSGDYEYHSKYQAQKKDFWSTSLIKQGEKLWLGTNDGLLCYEKGEITNPYQGDRLLSASITCIERFNDSVVLLGTKGEGVLLFKNETVEKVISTANGLVSNIVRALHVDDEGVIWVGTTKGISRVNLNQTTRMEIYNLTQKHGLVSEEITALKSYRDTLYVGTVKGALTLNRKKLALNHKPPVVSIIEVKVNRKLKRLDSLALLTYTENNILIKYEGVNYRSQGTVDYQYRLLGNELDTNWSATQSRFSEYTLLPSGTYNFEVKAKNEDGIWSQPQKISFIIHAPFWKTWWFILSMFLLFGSIVFLIVFTIVKNREEKLRVEKQLVELELKALRSQMNPHFIFNILNSIQHYMLNNNFKETNRYLTQFARLIRSVLNVSEKQYISIGEELEMLRLYMNLEKMRFEDGFDYEIIVDEAIDEDYDEIPSMLIQPYVENAIWHGLMNKGTKGKIRIGIALREKTLYCTIDDNGVGRAAAAKLKARRKIKSKSVGMRITKDRLNILNEDSNINVIIEDKKDEKGQATGTKVEIRVGYTN